jgi:dTMP kinase
MTLNAGRHPGKAKDAFVDVGPEFEALLQRMRQRPHSHPGKLIAMCGVDGSGKSTLASAVYAELSARGQPATIIRMPSDSIRGYPLFRQLFSDDADARGRVDAFAINLMVMGDRIQQLREEMLPALQRGRVVICDRYVYTGLVESAVRGADPLEMLVDIAGIFPMPDVAVLTSCPVPVALARIRARPDEKDTKIDEDLFVRLSSAFHRLAHCLGVTVLDTSGNGLGSSAARSIADQVRGGSDGV